MSDAEVVGQVFNSPPTLMAWPLPALSFVVGVVLEVITAVFSVVAERVTKQLMETPCFGDE